MRIREEFEFDEGISLRIGNLLESFGWSFEKKKKKPSLTRILNHADICANFTCEQLSQVIGYYYRTEDFFEDKPISLVFVSKFLTAFPFYEDDLLVYKTKNYTSSEFIVFLRKHGARFSVNLKFCDFDRNQKVLIVFKKGGLNE